jgi:hypothetical protein
VNARVAMMTALAALSLSACSGPQVRTLGNGGGAPAYELRGASMSAIDAQASRLCSHGYDVLRAAQSIATTDLDDSSGSLFVLDAGAWLSGMPGNQAQATIVCRG